jgi:hypothetical protein
VGPENFHLARVEAQFPCSFEVEGRVNRSRCVESGTGLIKRLQVSKFTMCKAVSTQLL